jgi:hypothetical protein
VDTLEIPQILGLSDKLMSIADNKASDPIMATTTCGG